MEITLVNPLIDKYQRPDLYLSILYLATHMHRNGYKVNVVDCQTEKDPQKKLRSLVKSSQCIGFTVMSSQVAHALKLSDFLKSLDPDIPIVWGGIHPTIYPGQTAEDKSVDYVVVGEGEETFLELNRHLSGGMDVSKIRGLVYKKNREVKANPERPFMDLNMLSPPEWDIINIRDYIEDFMVAGRNFGMSLPLHSGRGCSFRCRFCISAKRWRPLSVDNMINEVKILKDRYGLEHIKFVDENFFADKKRIHEFSRRLIDEGIDLAWHATCRASYFNKGHVNDELLELVKKAGCRVISMGIESGSQRMLDLIHKDITVEDALRAVEQCNTHGIIPMCSFMMGLPGEKREDMDKTLSLIQRIKQISPGSVIIGPQIFRPYPGCELYEMIKGSFRQPATLREWRDIDFMGGYTKVKHLPWVEDPEYVSNVGFYVSRIEFEPHSALRRIADFPLKKMAKYRLDHRIFSFPVEKKAFETSQKVNNRLRGR